MEQRNENKKIVLIGDSTIDNIVWVQSSNQSIPEIIRAAMPDYTIINYAADGFTSSNVMQGAIPAISMFQRRQSGDPFPNEVKFCPLEELKKLEGVSHIVISIGGNDIREILGKMSSLFSKLQIFNQNYPEIIRQSLNVTPNVIVMLQYRPSFYQDECYGVYQAMEQIPGLGNSIQKINQLMESIYNTVFKELRKHNIAIIDLPNTFDIFNPALFNSQIEPSAEGGLLIAHLIKYVVQNHTFQQSALYSISNPNEDQSQWKVEVTNNSEGYQWKIVHFNDFNEAQISNAYTEQLEQLEQMGFSSQELNKEVLQSTDGNVEAAVEILLSKM